MEDQSTSTSKKKFNFKDKKIVGAVIAVLLIILLAAGAFFMFGNSSSSNDSDSDSLDSIGASDLPELSPEDVGMVVTVRDDNRAVMFELTEADDIEYVEYIIEYEAQVEDAITNQGIFGEMNIGKDGITETDFREFGTCSAGKCRYDDVTSDITINLKVIKKDGSEYQVTEVVELDLE